MPSTAKVAVATAPHAGTAGLDTERAVRWFHALSDETRLDIVEQLLRGERCVCELTEDLDAAQSRLSFHLKTLKDAGLVTDRREGRWVYYAVNHDTFAQIETLVGSLARSPKGTPRTDPCCG
jgi:ArsR family transcriptional regulator, arsenate/arsenite/antimonite-responsive transcriptional repressor